MDNELKTLISLCEEEKAELQKLIKERLAEEEYLLAHYHSSALHQLNRRLQTLHNIDDNLYDDKQIKLRRICWLEKQIDGTDAEAMKQYFSKELLKVNEALEKLNKTSSQTTSKETTSLIDDALIRLLNKKIKNVKLILKKADNFFLAFAYSNKTLKITLPQVKQHIKGWRLNDEKVEILKNLGFEMPENGNKLILTIAGDKQEILSRLKLILLKIVFEIFYYKEFENETFIQFTEKVGC